MRLETDSWDLRDATKVLLMLVYVPPLITCFKYGTTDLLHYGTREHS